MTREEAEKYKNYPEGSLSKKSYDSVFMPFEEFLKKYYQVPDLKRWVYCYSKFILPLFDGTPLEQYESDLFKIKPSFKPDITKLMGFWKIIENDVRFDSELKETFCFLYSIDFFRENSFEEWIKIINWNHPWYTDENSNMKSITEILSYEFGVNYLKTILAELNIFK